MHRRQKTAGEREERSFSKQVWDGQKLPLLWREQKKEKKGTRGQGSKGKECVRKGGETTRLPGVYLRPETKGNCSREDRKTGGINIKRKAGDLGASAGHKLSADEGKERTTG